MILQQEDTLDMAVKENKDLMKDSKKGEHQNYNQGLDLNFFGNFLPKLMNYQVIA